VLTTTLTAKSTTILQTLSFRFLPAHAAQLHDDVREMAGQDDRSKMQRRVRSMCSAAAVAHSLTACLLCRSGRVSAWRASSSATT
jgi:hypothetical protein